MDLRRFKIHAPIKIINGKSHSIIIDLQKGSITRVPLDLAIKIINSDGELISEINKNKEQKEIVEYFKSNKLCFFTKYPDRFPKLSDAWSSPAIIENALIDINSFELDIDNVLTELEDLGCNAIQIRIFNNQGLDGLDLYKFLLTFKKEFFLRRNFILSTKSSYS